MSSRVWIVHSIFPSVWRWQALLNFNLVPIVSWRSCQKWEVKCVSLSDSIVFGTPCSRNVSSMNNWVNFFIGSVFFTGKKLAHFFKWLTTTQIELLTVDIHGNLTKTSIEMSSHFHFGIGSGCNSRVGLWCSTLTTLHTKNLFTYSTTSLFMPSHQKCCFKS